MFRTSVAVATAMPAPWNRFWLVAIVTRSACPLPVKSAMTAASRESTAVTPGPDYGPGVKFTVPVAGS